MELDLTIALCLRDFEAAIPTMVRSAVELARKLERSPLRERQGELEFEILALDEGSRDNSLSVLSLLQARIPELRCVQDLPPGTAPMRAARVARGKVWLIADRPIDRELGQWAVEQIFCGHRAAIVPGELLALERGLGQSTLGWMRGGLLRAQYETRRALEATGERAVRTPPRHRGLRHRAGRFLRENAARVGLARLDRPRGA